MTDRMIQACPECGHCNYWRAWKGDYRCLVCHAVFEQPVEREAKRGPLPPTISAERRERYRAKEAARKEREARYLNNRAARVAARWEQKIAEAKAKWHEKFGDMQ